MRVAEEFAMPLPAETPVLRPETALLKWNGIPRRSDVGQLCYLKRETGSRQRNDHTFDESTLDADRVTAVRNLILHLSDACRLGAKRPYTLFEATSGLIQFVNWADANGRHSVLCQELATEEALKSYFEMLRDEVSRNKRNQNAVANKQGELLRLLREYFKNDGFAPGIRRMRGGRKFVTNTEVPDDSKTGPMLAWSDVLFRTVVEHLDSRGPYPIELRGPTETIWLPPTQLRQGSANRRTELGCWDIKTGQLVSVKAVEDTMRARGRRQPERSAMLAMARARANLQKANATQVNPVRLSHGVAAAYCFAALFLAETGINQAQLLEMAWSEEIRAAIDSPTVVRQKFREVKYRAAGKVIAFQVSLGFMPKLKQYLLLRDYLCQGQPYETLFISLAPNKSLTSLNEQFMRQLYDRLRGYGVPLPKTTSRQWRAAKQDWVVRKHGPVVAAKVMGHTLETALKAYSNGTESAHRDEMGAFLASVEQTVLEKDQRPQNAVDSAVGLCVGFRRPEALSPALPVRPDCRSSEGCLFCAKHRIHADETDARKLISCRYCVRMTSNRAASVEEYDRSFGAVLRRIEFLLSELKKRIPLLVDEIERDVDVNGNLDGFWASKLEQLFELGLA
ncbi:integrase [Paraburkholderia sediminicola]|uniref:integrase n=1 Tax=Paraburkholderia sediminicola TaxID=458836 RepID=UPI0038B7FC1F